MGDESLVLDTSQRVLACHRAASMVVENANGKRAKIDAGSVDTGLSDSSTQTRSASSGSIADVFLESNARAVQAVQRDLDLAKRLLLQGCRLGDTGCCGRAMLVEQQATSLQVENNESSAKGKLAKRVRGAMASLSSKATISSVQEARRRAPLLA